MPNLLAMSFEGPVTPAFDLHCLEPGRKLPDGWGIGCYPGGEPVASVLKEAAPAHDSIRGTLVSTWERLESSIFVVHVRTATWGALTEANTQPFHRPWARRDWLMGHSGSLEKKLDLHATFEPVGSTDSEQVFCALLARFADRDWRTIGAAPPEVLLGWFHELNRLGCLTATLSDGTDLVVYADRKGQAPVYVTEIFPPHGTLSFGDKDLTVDLGRRGIHSRKGILVCTESLMAKSGSTQDWRRLGNGHLLVLREGAVVAEARPDMGTVVPQLQELPQPFEAPSAGDAVFTQADLSPTQRVFVARAKPRQHLARVEPRRYDVTHRTVYRYQKAVERSVHLLRLFPMHDRLQAVRASELTVSVDGQARDFEDVFGNRVRRVMLDTAFTELVIEARSDVELLDVDPLDFRPPRVRSTIPLAWMPWQRQVLDPFLLPPELPESELLELTEYAMSFARRNDFELLDTLLDLNATIFNEYQYRQGSTTLHTTAFDVYVHRRGVCQDFSNLFICLARLLGVPARYVCGYLFTGPQALNARMAEASHAWVQVYLPEAGWKGFDPTNGVITQTEHVRVAVGRNYMDATPTSGTIYVGGGPETLGVDVHLTQK
jgi:transglutaminase-like putative cysteine protease/predicted glutamine amidotransferase